LPHRLRDYERFQDNEVNNDGDFVHFALMAESEPVNEEEALSDPKWICAMKEELESIEKNGTWELVDLPLGKKSIGVRWVYKVKANPKGEVIKHKARLMAKEFLQREGIDYEEVFAPVARLETIRLIVGIAHNNNGMVYQMDVKSAFLNGPCHTPILVLNFLFLFGTWPKVHLHTFIPNSIFLLHIDHCLCLLIMVLLTIKWILII